MKANLVDDFELLLNKGDIMPYFNPQRGYSQLMLVCPGCGEKSASNGSHRYDPETISYTPSIVHDKSLGGCGWHGWLTNGEFKSC